MRLLGFLIVSVICLCVRCDGVCSNVLSIHKGVPQGSVLGSLGQMWPVRLSVFMLMMLLYVALLYFIVTKCPSCCSELCTS